MDKDRLLSLLDNFAIEVPSWGFADTGTRFGKFLQDAAAVDLSDKLEDAGQCHALTGCCPTVAMHVLWDFTKGQNPAEVSALAEKFGVKIGSINANLFQDQCYKYGSFGNPDPAVRERALEHVVDCVELSRDLKSPITTLWFADGTNYPGQDSMRSRKRRFEETLKKAYKKLDKEQQFLIEYKPFEPAFYQTDIGDWGMSYIFCKKLGPKAKVLVDTGHHFQSQNIEQIVAWLLDEQMLGGFHFNDRRYADDDLTLGSIDPYQIFRIFHEIHSYAADLGAYPPIAYMIDQSHNLKPKVEAMVQTAVTAQELYLKAAMVDRDELLAAQAKTDIVAAETILKNAFFADVSGVLKQWRKAKGLPVDPIAALRKSNYIARKGTERVAKRVSLGLVSGGGYA
ncbi:MAG: TIM barrel protein [Verrucomicrobiota bacterium]|nr:TIM barrel protein [Verrucomicrobiota bacterium]